jgi:hypothetical protein
MPSIGQTWVVSIGAVVEMGILSTLKRLLMESLPPRRQLPHFGKGRSRIENAPQLPHFGKGRSRVENAPRSVGLIQAQV